MSGLRLSDLNTETTYLPFTYIGSNRPRRNQRKNEKK